MTNMINKDITHFIHSLFSQTIIDLFKDMDCIIASVEQKEFEIEDSPVAFIDCGSADAELEVALQLPLSVLAMTYPVKTDSSGNHIVTVDEESLEDWLSELSNQLIGRLKNKLLKHNLLVDIGLPNSYFGTPIDELISTEHGREEFVFDVDGEICACYLSVQLFSECKDFSFEEITRPGDLQESELELF